MMRMIALDVRRFRLRNMTRHGETCCRRIFEANGIDGAVAVERAGWMGWLGVWGVVVAAAVAAAALIVVVAVVVVGGG